MSAVYKVAYEVCEARVAMVEANSAKEAREIVETDRVCPGDTRSDGTVRRNVMDVWLEAPEGPQLPPAPANECCNAAKYLAKIAAADTLGPCVHGHIDCALVAGGRCSAEMAAQCGCEDCQ